MRSQNQFVLWLQLLSFLCLISPVSVNAEYDEVAQVGTSEIAVRLNEFSFEVSSQTIKAGKIRFRVQNQGSEAHEFVVSRKEKGHFKEIKEIEPFAPGSTQEMTLSLSPGTYELSCKVVEEEAGETLEHYKKGMHIIVRVVKPLRIGGSGADLGTMRVLGEALRQSHPLLLLEVLPSLGSGGGIKATLSGRLDIGLSTRPLKEAERKRGAREIRYASTPFIFATSKENTQSSLSHQDIVDIYNRARTTWDDGSIIRIVLRPDNDSDIHILRRHFPEIDPAPFTGRTWRGFPTAFTDQKSADLTQDIPGGMGMSTLSLLLAEKRPLKPLAIDGVSPTPRTIADGSYPMKKTLSFILGPEPDPLVKVFLDFVQSERGKAVLQKTGHLTLNETDG